MTRFIDHLQIATTTNNNVIANFHTLQSTTTCNKFSQSAFTSRFPATDLNNGDSLATVLSSLLSSEYPTTELLLQTVLVLTSRYAPLRKHRFLLL
jgi:hypothetical protein